MIVVVETSGSEIDATAAKSRFRLGSVATKFDDRANVEARSTMPAYFGLRVEGAHDLAALPSEGKAYGSCHHLLGADPHALPALDAVLKLRVQPDLADTVTAGEVLNGFGLRRGSHIKFQQ